MNKNAPSTSSLSGANKQNSLNFTECTQAYFNRAKFFFNPANIQKQARLDRRFLQRLNREAAHATVRSFYPIDCEEEDLPENFNLLYKKLLQGEIGSARIYQLILNTLIYYYSKRTWSTSVPKCVFESLEEFLLKDMHKSIEQKPLLELETVCLLELFILRYKTGNGAKNLANEDHIHSILVQIRQIAGEGHLYTFFNNAILNHFGYSLEPRLRNICGQLDLRVKLYRSDPFIPGQMPTKKRKFSIQLSQEGAGSSELTHSSSEEWKEPPDEESSEGMEEIEEDVIDDNEVEEEDGRSPTPPTVKAEKQGRKMSTFQTKSSSKSNGGSDIPTSTQTKVMKESTFEVAINNLETPSNSNNNWSSPRGKAIARKRKKLNSMITNSSVQYKQRSRKSATKRRTGPIRH